MKPAPNVRNALLAVGAVQFGRSIVAEAQEAEKAAKQTEAVIKSTGGTANVTADEIGNLAEAISKKTGVDDEQIQSGENMMAVSVTNNDKSPAGLALKLTIQYADGKEEVVATGEKWTSGKEGPDGWTTATESLPTWQAAEILGDIGMKPWGKPTVATPGAWRSSRSSSAPSL